MNDLNASGSLRMQMHVRGCALICGRSQSFELPVPGVTNFVAHAPALAQVSDLSSTFRSTTLPWGMCSKNYNTWCGA